MKSSTRVFFTFGTLVLIIVFLYFFTDWFSKTTGYVLGEDQQITFVQCLNDKNTVLYLEDDCIDCLKQQEIFAPSAFALLTVASCDTLDCSNLRSLPAWEISGQLSYGFKDFLQLRDLSLCPLPS